MAASDEHDEDGVLISDEFTNPLKRRKMVEKRARKFEQAASSDCPACPGGPRRRRGDAGRLGSTYRDSGGHRALAGQRRKANQLAVKWIVPFHAAAVRKLVRAQRTIIVENNFSGQFARYLRSETGFTAHGHIRKYDGEPFKPHHIVAGVLDSCWPDEGSCARTRSRGVGADPPPIGRWKPAPTVE